MDPPKIKGMSKLRSRRFTAEEQKQALLSGDGAFYLPEKAEVVIVAGPRARDFKKLRKVLASFLYCIVFGSVTFDSLQPPHPPEDL
jgi:hypothetical protein